MSQLDPVSESNELSGSVGNNGTNGALATIESQLQTVPALGWSYGPPQRPDILTAKPNPLDLLHAVRRRWPLAIGTGLAAGLLAAGLVWFFVPVKYEAFAWLRVAEKPGQVLEKSNEGTEGFSIFKRTQAQLIRSGPVLRGTMRVPQINNLSIIQENNEDPVSWLQDQLIIEYPDDAEILRVAIKAKKPGDALKIINTIVDRYLVEVVAQAREDRIQHEAKVEGRYSDIVKEYTDEAKALYDMEQVQKTSSTEAAQVQKQVAQEGLLEAIVQRNTVMREIRETDLEIAMKKARENEPDSSIVPEAVVEMELKRDPVVYDLTKRKSEYEGILAHHMTLATNPSKSSLIRKYNEIILQLEQAIDDQKANARPHVIEMLKAKDMIESDPSRTAMTVPMLEARKEHLTKELDLARLAIDEEVKRFDALTTFSADVTARREALAAKKEIMNRLKAELDKARVERLAQERITKVDEAQLASPRGDAIQKYVGVSVAGIVGFGLVVVGIAFAEFQSRKLHGSQQVKEGLGIKVVGELPNVSGRTWRRIKGGKGPAVLKALMAERIDGTRTALIHSAAVDAPRVVMVTSADPHEGKTTTSSQLAASLARAGRRTLLVDADIRNPGAHRVFDMPLEPGLSELLRGEAERDAVVHPTRTANLWLLPAGHCDLRSVQALSTSYLGTAIAALCVQFDYVVIDSGPILKVADSLLVGQHADVAILSVLKDHSKMENVYEACERLRSVGITVMGTVVNGVNDDAARHGVELLMSETK
jgi:capsular exopolysaccharide synthesis family protein